MKIVFALLLFITSTYHLYMWFVVQFEPLPHLSLFPCQQQLLAFHPRQAIERHQKKKGSFRNSSSLQPDIIPAPLRVSSIGPRLHISSLNCDVSSSVYTLTYSPYTGKAVVTVRLLDCKYPLIITPDDDTPCHCQIKTAQI